MPRKKAPSRKRTSKKKTAGKPGSLKMGTPEYERYDERKAKERRRRGLKGFTGSKSSAGRRLKMRGK